MKILIFNWRDINHPWAGGSELNVHEMAKRWVKRGHEVTMLTAHYYGNSLHREKETIDSIQIIRLGGRFTLYILAPLYYLLCLRSKCDVIIDVENGIPFFTPLYSGKPKICLVNHVHKRVFFTELKFPANYLGYCLETKVMPCAYKRTPFVAISETTKEDLRSIGVDNNRVQVVYAGLDHGFYNTNGANKFDKPTIVYLGRLRKYKRVGILVDIMPQLRESVPGIQLIIAGDGDDRHAIEEKIREMNLQDNVRVTGYINDKKKVELLQKSWLYVTPSSMEGWGLSVIEANACGTAAIAFQVPGLSEAIKDGKSGYLVKDSHELIKRITEILTDHEMRRALSQGAVERAAEFDWERSADQFLQKIKSTREGNKRD